MGESGVGGGRRRVARPCKDRRLEVEVVAAIIGKF